MSLRIFHIVFVVVSTVLSLYVTLWGFREFARERSTMALVLGVLFLLTAIALVLYGRKAFAKLKALP